MNRSRILCIFLAVIGAVNLACGQGTLVLAPGEEWERLRAQVAEQRGQIQQLKDALEDQKQMIAALMKSGAAAPDVSRPASPTNSLTEDASAVKPVAQTLARQQTPEEVVSPLQFRIGTAAITPVGFMDFTSVSRSTNAGTGIGGSFGSIPFTNTAAGSLTETKLSAQNSRFGFRVDAAVNGTNVYSYLQRSPWSVAAGQPSEAHYHVGFMNLRYTFPGSAPAVR
jgi:hypothetical protein